MDTQTNKIETPEADEAARADAIANAGEIEFTFRPDFLYKLGLVLAQLDMELQRENFLAEILSGSADETECRCPKHRYLDDIITQLDEMAEINLPEGTYMSDFITDELKAADEEAASKQEAAFEAAQASSLLALLGDDADVN